MRGSSKLSSKSIEFGVLNLFNLTSASTVEDGFEQYENRWINSF